MLEPCNRIVEYPREDPRRHVLRGAKQFLCGDDNVAALWSAALDGTGSGSAAASAASGKSRDENGRPDRETRHSGYKRARLTASEQYDSKNRGHAGSPHERAKCLRC